ncbi:unnamed protein product [Nezara viridula]|uniref:Chaoptin n=1 Tax=Nezara viridula TaxID=85310 RepID=A0A9P0H8I3_NEZVI|nr:unnamed protein product [Nezara viridula]
MGHCNGFPMGSPCNSISSLSGDWSGVATTLTNLYLGENDLVELSVQDLRKLLWLNADGNMLSSLEAGSVPPTLQTLSVSNNLIASFPTDFLEESKRISWLYLRDNLINRIPYYNFKHRKKLEKLDLGENCIKEIPMNPFNGTLSVRDLNLDLNEIRTLGPNAFNGLSPGRVYLSQNGLEEIHIDAFAGLESTLEYLDLGGNLLQEVPKALSRLKKLKYLYLPSNNISHIPNDTFNNYSGTLGALSLHGNRLEAIPADALRGCGKLYHLNIGYNHIMEITEEDFEHWGESLDTLLLMNNRLVQIHGHTFRQTPRLRELSLSFNKISAIDTDAFVDVEDSLESLEISFGLYQEEFPEDFLKPLRSLVWLALDNNSFRSISQSALYSFKNLQYLNLDGNRLSMIPVGLFHPSVHRNLRDIRFSYNHIMSVDPHTFTNLVSLQSIVLSGNQIKILKPNAFKSLPGKLSVILSDNKLTTISPRAFNDIATMVRLDLQSNALQEFSLSAFHNVTAPYLPLSLNLSRNEISNLLVAETMRSVCIHTIDLSHNQIIAVPKDFFQEIYTSIRRIYLGYNRISKLDETAFGNLSPLQALSLQHNSIVSLRKRAFVGLPNLQILDLSHNHIEQIHMEQFKSLPNLRIVDLSYNHIRSIPRDAFQNTKLERLDLSNNEFVVMPSGALGEVGFTMRVLDIAHNQIEHLDGTMFPETPLLSALGLGYNKISTIPDNVFSSLSGILRLDLAGNRLRANLKELFHYLNNLRHLDLADTGLRDFPSLALPNLVSLNLSGNPLGGLSSAAVAAIPKLRQLDLSRCRIIALPPIWEKIPFLKVLNLADNPVTNLEWLDLIGLERLQSLQIDRLTSETPGLRKLTLKVSSSSGPRLGRLGRKLRHLELTGGELRTLTAGSLRGTAGGNELVLQIRGTALEELPLGLLAALGRVPHLSLDLRNNRLSSLSPDTLYYNLTSWEDMGNTEINNAWNRKKEVRKKVNENSKEKERDKLNVTNRPGTVKTNNWKGSSKFKTPYPSSSSPI